MSTTFGNGIFSQVGTNTSSNVTITASSSSNNQFTVSPNTTGLALNQPVVFSFTTISTPASQTTNPGNYLLLGTTTNVVVGMPISLSATLGTMVGSTVYYIYSITSTTPIPVGTGNVSRTGTTATVNTQNVHGLSTGQIVSISGTGTALDSDSLKVITVTNTTQFTYTSGSSGTITSTSAGTVTPAPQVQVSTTNGGAVFTQNNTSGTVTASIGGVFGNVVAGTTYYVANVVDSTHITISAKSGGSVFALATAVGSMAAAIGGATPIIISPSNGATTVIGLTAANLTVNLALVTVYLLDANNNNNVANFAYQIPVPPNMTLDLVNGGMKIVLGNNVSLYAYANVPNSIDITASYVIVQ